MSLTPLQEWLIVELRKTLLLSNDDLLDVTCEFISPYLTLPILDHCLEKHEVGTVETLQTELGLKITGKEPGFIRLIVKMLPLMPNESKNKYLFVAIDQTSHWIFHQVSDDNRSYSKDSFLNELLKAAPFRIHSLFTNAFDEFSNNEYKPGTKKTLTFNELCLRDGIQHHLLKSISHIAGVEARYEDIEAALENQQPDCWREWGSMLSRYVTIYNQLIPQKSLGNLTPLRKLKELHAYSPKLFKPKTKPKNRPIVCTHPFNDLMHAICDVFDLYHDDMKHQGEKKLRIKELKEKQFIQSRHAFLLKHFDRITEALSTKDKANHEARKRRLLAYEQLCLDITNTLPFSFNSKQVTLRNYFIKALIPVMAIEIFTDNSIHSEFSLYHHLHHFICGGSIEKHSSIYSAARGFLRQYIKDLNFSNGDITAEISIIISRLSQRQGQGMSSLIVAYNEGRNNNINKTTAKENEEKLQKLQHAHHAIVLMLYFERHTSMGMEFVNYYKMLVAKEDCTQPLLRKLTALYKHLESNWCEDEEEKAHYHFWSIQQRNEERYYQPIVDFLLWNTINENEMPFDKYPAGSILVLSNMFRTLLSDNDVRYLEVYGLRDIVDIRRLKWSHRVMAKPYNCIMNIIRYIENNELEKAFELASDAPYHEDDVFGFHLAFFSMIYIALRVKFRKKNKINYRELSAHVTNASMYHGFAANIRVHYSDEINNPITDSLYNVTIMRSIYFYNRLVIFLANRDSTNNIERLPQSIDGVLYEFELGVGKFLNALKENGIVVSLLDDNLTKLKDLKSQFDTDYYRGNLISFLVDSSLKNCIQASKALLGFLGNQWEMSQMPNIQSIIEHDNDDYIEKICKFLPQNTKDGEK